MQVIYQVFGKYLPKYTEPSQCNRLVCARWCAYMLMYVDDEDWSVSMEIVFTNSHIDRKEEINRSLSPDPNTNEFVLCSFNFASHSIAFRFPNYTQSKVTLNDFYRWQWFHAYLFTFVRIEMKSQFYWKQIDDLFSVSTEFHIRLQTLLCFRLCDRMICVCADVNENDII